MRYFLWTMFIICCFCAFQTFLNLSRAAEHLTAMLGILVFGFGLIVYYATIFLI